MRVVILWMAMVFGVAACGGTVDRGAPEPAGSHPENADPCAWSTVKWMEGVGSEDSPQLGQCLPGSLRLDSAGRAPCVVFDFLENPDGACTCNPGRSRLPVSHAPEAAYQRAHEVVASVGVSSDCACEYQQASPEDLAVCQSAHPTPGELQTVDGFCYLDGAVSPPIGNPDDSEACAAHVVLQFGAWSAVPAGETHLFVVLCGAPECTIAPPP